MAELDEHEATLFVKVVNVLFAELFRRSKGRDLKDPATMAEIQAETLQAVVEDSEFVDTAEALQAFKQFRALPLDEEADACPPRLRKKVSLWN
jgi:hypothetical protein